MRVGFIRAMQGWYRRCGECTLVAVEMPEASSGRESGTAAVEGIGEC